MPDAIPALINLRYPVTLLDHRVVFHALRPGWEAERLEAMTHHVKPGQVVYDVGAEEGDFTALYGTWVGDAGVVVPIEPQRGYWPAIRQTWEANELGLPPPWCITALISDEVVMPPEAEWPLYRGWPSCTEGEVVPDVGFRHLVSPGDSPQLTLDEVAMATGLLPDHVVLDIEGAELKALQGAPHTVEARSTCWWVSIHPTPLAEWYGATPDDLHRLMLAAGYDLHELSVPGERHEDFVLYEPRP